MIRTRSGVRGAFVGKYALPNDGKDCARGTPTPSSRHARGSAEANIGMSRHSTHVGKPSNYGRGKYLMYVLVQGRRQ
jgi:hypothetical protein